MEVMRQGRRTQITECRKENMEVIRHQKERREREREEMTDERKES